MLPRGRFQTHTPKINRTGNFPVSGICYVCSKVAIQRRKSSLGILLA